MANERKIRNLIERDSTDPETITLDQIIFKATSLTPVLTDLEYGNKKTHIVDAKRQARELLDMVNQFKKRLQDEVYPEVLEEKAKNKHKYNQDVSRLEKDK